MREKKDIRIEKGNKFFFFFETVIFLTETIWEIAVRIKLKATNGL